MIAPGIRVARGPNWIWNDQGKKEEIFLTFKLHFDNLLILLF